MGELVTRYDLKMTTTHIQRDFEASIASLQHRIESSVATLRNDPERLDLRLTLRPGRMFGTSVAILAAIIEL
jgi:hypothetical protein